eukprot:Nk52_evm40s2192 gene=Nk52_evmTU40s2192
MSGVRSIFDAVLSVSSKPVRGFNVLAVSSGLKKKSLTATSSKGLLDFALLYARKEYLATTNSACVFTQNKFAAAPVILSKSLLDEGRKKVGGVIVNSGGANACTGEEGYGNAVYMSEQAKRICYGGGKEKEGDIMVMSTGVIGEQLDRKKLDAGFEGLELALKENNRDDEAVYDIENAANAIVTTDTFSKVVAYEWLAGEIECRIAGIAKGSGMIHPNMATMLGVIITDAYVDPKFLKSCLSKAIQKSFNCISVDGDTSTNDCVLVVSNGASGLTNAINGDVPSSSKEEEKVPLGFEIALTKTCIGLAKKIVQDGEGASKFITVIVEGGRSYEENKAVASAVASSSLVKTAMAGCDANWGRIVCAAGYSESDFDPAKLNLWMSRGDEQGLECETLKESMSNAGCIHLVKSGSPFEIDEEKASAIVKEREIRICIDLGMKDNAAEKLESRCVFWASDLTHGYVQINADYRT